MIARWKWPLLVLAVPIAMVALALLVGAGPGSELSGSITAWVEASAARHAARLRDREPAWGEAEPGAAFEHYAVARRLAADLPPAARSVMWDSRRRVATRAGAEVCGAELQDHRATWAPILACIQRGARAADARRPTGEWGLLHVAFGLDVEVGSLLADARGTHAVRLWLDDCTFRLDCGLFVHALAHFDDDTLARLSDADLLQLDAGLQRIERRLLEPADPEREFAAAVRRLLDGEYALVDWHWQQVLAASSWGFDPSLQHLAALHESHELLPLLAPTAPEPNAPTAAERGAQWRAFRAAPRSVNSEFARAVEQHAEDQEQAARWSLLHLRTLRIGIACRRGAPLPELLDPWTGALLPVRRELDAVVVQGEQPGAKPVRWRLWP